jgi:hypothetical protein
MSRPTFAPEGLDCMKCLTRPACVLAALLGGAGLLHLGTQALQHPYYGPGFHHAWALTFLGLGLLLAGASFGVRMGLGDRSLALRRPARLLILGGISLGTTLALLGLLAVLAPLL